MARTLLETVCKHILDENGTTYKQDADLPELYRKTAEVLNIAPSNHTEQVFKQILGGCTAVVEGGQFSVDISRCPRTREAASKTSSEAR